MVPETEAKGDAVLGIDLGQGGSRAVLVYRGTRTTAIGPGYWGGPVDAVVAVLAGETLAAAGLERPQLTVGVGMSGFDRCAEPARRVHGAIASQARQVSVTVADDGLTSYLGALGYQAGAVIAAGTGSVALALDPGRIAARADGWGSDLGDHGSGYWIGRQAVRHAVRAFDDGTCDELTEAVAARWGPLERLSESWRRGRPTPMEVADFAPAVASLANAGHGRAVAIMESAGRLLAETVCIALDRAGLLEASVPVATTGGVFDAGTMVLEPFRTELKKRAPRAFLLAPAAMGEDGGLMLADLPLDESLSSLADRHRVGI